MPLFNLRRSIPFSLGRRRTVDDANTGACSNAKIADKSSSSSSSRSVSSRRHSDSELAVPAVPVQGGKAMRIKVPSDAEPGDSISVRTPDGRLVDVKCPPGCKAGQHITVQMERSGRESADSTLKQLIHTVRTHFDATQASCKSVRAKLREELELQKGLWMSAASCSQSASYNSFSSGTSLTPAVFSIDELSQSQVLVFAAAEVGDGKQLLAALAEAKQFSAVSLSLEQCCDDLNATEEAMLTWRCLLDALQAENRHEIEVWIEEARRLGLEIPSGFDDALHELGRREVDSLKHMQQFKEIEERLKFALEAAVPELLEAVVAEATAIGSTSSLVQQAISHLRAHRQASSAPKQMLSSAKKPAGGQWLPRPASPPRGRSERAGPGLDQARQPSDSPPPPLFPKMQPENLNFSHQFGKNAQPENFNFTQDVGDSFAQGIPSSSSTFRRGGEPEIRAYPSNRAYAQSQQAPLDDGKTVKELFEECRRLGIDTRGCTDRSDLQGLLRNAPKSTPSPPESHQGFVIHVPKPRSSQASAPDTAADSVWKRKFAPPHYITKRSQSLYLLGLDSAKPLKQSELRTAYRKCAMECHPDRAQNHSRQEQAKELFQQVKDAFDLLSSQSGFTT